MRRYFVFYLLPVFFAFLGYSVMVGWWWSLKRHEALLEKQAFKLDEAQEPAIQAIERLGGEVVRDHFRHDLGWPVISARLGSSSNPVSDSDLMHLKSFRHIQSLSIHGARLEGDGLSYLKDLPALTRIQIDSHVTDKAVSRLEDLRQLRYLSICSRSMTDHGLASVAKLYNLRHLTIRKAGITDEGLAHLDFLGTLEVLEFVDTRVTEAGVREFRLRHPEVKLIFNPEIIAPDPPPLRLPKL